MHDTTESTLLSLSSLLLSSSPLSSSDSTSCLFCYAQTIAVPSAWVQAINDSLSGLGHEMLETTDEALLQGERESTVAI
jgi:hypothetical protein